MIEAIPLADGMADVVIASLVLHEVKSLSQALREIHRILKKDGRFLCVELEPKQNLMKVPRISSESMERALNQEEFRVIKRFFPVESALSEMPDVALGLTEIGATLVSGGTNYPVCKEMMAVKQR